MNELELFQTKFRTSELEITISEFWAITLRPGQVTPGAMILSLRRPCKSLAQLTAEESLELQHCFKFIEELLSKSFQPKKINYMALMMVDAQVHFHVIPRYDSPVRVDGILIHDPDWPKPPDLSRALNIDEQHMLKILRSIHTQKLSE